MNKHDDFTQFNPDKTEKLLWSYSGNYRRNCQVYFPFPHTSVHLKLFMSPLLFKKIISPQS